MPTDSYVTTDEPSQLLGKHSFVFVCVNIICNQIRIEHNLFLSFNTMPTGKASIYDLTCNEHLQCANEKLHVLMSLLCPNTLCHCYACNMLIRKMCIAF